jgi:hypothetical protein
MKNFRNSLIVVCFFFYIVSCSKEETTTPTPTGNGIVPNANGKITYASLSPLFSASCGGSTCHTANVGPLLINNYAVAKASGAKIVSEVTSKKMPKNSSLTQAQIDAVKQWQTDGFLEK